MLERGRLHACMFACVKASLQRRAGCGIHSSMRLGHHSVSHCFPPLGATAAEQRSDGSHPSTVLHARAVAADRLQDIVLSGVTSVVLSPVNLAAPKSGLPLSLFAPDPRFAQVGGWARKHACMEMLQPGAALQRRRPVNPAAACVHSKAHQALPNMTHGGCFVPPVCVQTCLRRSQLQANGMIALSWLAEAARCSM